MIFQWRKWDGSPHWRHECVYLGADEWGDWVGQPVGWGSERPGRAYAVGCPSVTLIPDPQSAAFEAAGLPHKDFALTVNRGHHKGMRIYIDLGWDIHWGAASGTLPASGSLAPAQLAPRRATPGELAPQRDGQPAFGSDALVTGIAMDLDVVRVAGPRGTWVDDRDEWAVHSARYGYPRPVMDRLEQLALDLEQRVRAQTAPFDDATADAWLDRVVAFGQER